MPFLEILTRCYKRPTMLAVNQESLATQTDKDFIQTLLVDDVGIGINATHERMGAYAPNLIGEYIFCLDDDDMCICHTLVADLKTIVAEHDPDVIMVKMDHMGIVLPQEPEWGVGLRYGGIGMSAYIVKREVWQAHAGALTPGWYGSDYSLINSIFGNNPAMAMAPWIRQPAIYWHDCIASKVQRQSFGEPE